LVSANGHPSLKKKEGRERGVRWTQGLSPSERTSCALDSKQGKAMRAKRTKTEGGGKKHCAFGGEGGKPLKFSQQPIECGGKKKRRGHVPTALLKAKSVGENKTTVTQKQDLKTP